MNYHHNRQQYIRRSILIKLLGGLSIFLACLSIFIFFPSFTNPARASLTPDNMESGNEQLFFNQSREPTFNLDTNGLVETTESKTSEGEMAVGSAKIEAELTWNSQPIETLPKISTKDESGQFEIKLAASQFKPGLYQLKVNIDTESEDQTLTQDFTWGVLAINLDQSSYKVDEKANIGMAVLNDMGRTLCDAGLTLNITDPDNRTTTLSTSNKSIVVYDQCRDKNVTNIPDYSASYTPKIEGSYHIKLKAETANGSRSLDESFEVTNNPDFVISRPDTSMRIYPVAVYTVNIEVFANKDLSGGIKEKLPASFDISNISTGGQIIDKDETTQTITWPTSLKAGETIELSYQYDAPDVSPQFYLLGPIEVWQSTIDIDGGQEGAVNQTTIFTEPRAWQIASDAALLYVGGNSGSGTASTYNISLTALTGGSGSAALAGDIVIVVTGWASTANGDPGVTTSGYATDLADLYSSDTRDANVAVTWKIMGSTPDTSVTVSGFNNAANGGATVVQVWRGVNQTTPIDVTTTTASANNQSAARPNAPSITPSTAGAVILAAGLGTGDTTPTAFTTPSGMSNGISATGAGTTMSSIANIASYSGWSSGAYDPAAWTGGETTTSDSWAAASVVLRPATQITLSGGCFTDATEGTACTDDGANEIKVAVNGVVQTESDTTVDGAWTFTISQPSSGAVMVFFINGEATEAEEAATVTKYDGSGSVDLVKMYQSQLVIGTDSGSANSDQTVAITDLDTTTSGYEWSDDEDVLFDVTAGSDLTVDANGDKTETLYIISGDTYQPASGGGGDTTTHHLSIEGVLTADNNAISVAGNFTNTGTFTANTSTVTFAGTSAQTVTSGGTSFNNVIFNNSSGANPNINYTGEWAIGTNVTLSNAVYLASTDNTAITISGTIDGINILSINSGSGTVTFGGIIGGSTPITSLTSSGSGAVVINTTAITTRDIASNSVSFTGAVTLGGGLVIDTNNTTNDGAINFSSTINGTQTLNLDAGAADVSISGAIGGSTVLSSLTIGGNDITLANIGAGSAGVTGATSITGDTNGTITLTGTIYKTTGTQAYNAGGAARTITLNDGATFTTADNIVSFTGLVDSQTAENNSVTLNAGTAQVTFNNNIGASQSLGVLTKQGSGDLKFGSSTLTCTGLTLSAGTINTAATDSGAWTVSGDLTISSGTLTSTTNTLSVGGSWANSATFTHNSGLIDFTKGSGSQTLNSGGTGAGKIFNNLTHSGAGTLQLITNAINIDGVFTNSAGTFDANDLDMNVADDFLGNGGTFSADVSPGATTQTVTFDGTNEATVSGSNTFRNLTMDTTAEAAGKTIKFTAGTTQTITGTWTLDGDSGKVLTLRSTVTDTAWKFIIPADINPAGDYIDVQDSQNIDNGYRITAGANYADSGNNVPGWLFPSANTPPSAPLLSSLLQKKVTGGATLATGDWTNETQVVFSATTTDPDAADTLYLCVEYDLLTVAFSSADGGNSCGAGEANPSPGNPVTVTVTVTGLTNSASYHWQVQAKDTATAYSGWTTYGSNTENPPTDPADLDFGVDTSEPYDGTVNDGDGADVDYNSGSLSELKANWSGVNYTVSGLNKYEYAIGTTQGGTDTRTWTDNSTTASVTATGLSLRTGKTYYFSIRTTDNAGNVSTPISSNGQVVAPTLAFGISPASVTFDNLNSINFNNNTKPTTLTTSTNAYNGYEIKAYRTALLTYNSFTILDFNDGSYASPAAWGTGQCSGDSCGFGYTSSDTTIGGANKFGGGTLYAPFATSGPGEVVADHTTTVIGTPITDEDVTITNKVAVSTTQAAGIYTTTVVYTIIPNY